MAPKVTIGLMVYNEEQHVENTIKSILDQNYENFELLVGNNGSTDRSSKIIESYVRADSRIRHINRGEGIGALQNWNDLVRKAKGDYFILAGGHDLWSKNYLVRLVEKLDSNPDAVIAFSPTQWIDENGAFVDVPTSIIDTSGMGPAKRVLAISIANRSYLYALMRHSAVMQTRLQLEIVGSGEIFLQELGQMGSFALVENERWIRRKNRAGEDRMTQLMRYRDILFSKKWKKWRYLFFPNCQELLVYFSVPFVKPNVPLRTRLSVCIVVFFIVCLRLPNALWQDINWLVYWVKKSFS